ncbi:Uncharacterized conserved protein [Commensalibacter communis]|uniref:esterase-like activity of phytase family protein n=1 Tax=Commensalibacter communis TaxID=2972786 RepID=UPI0022FFB0C0|nr:esterase-like activity of phytase family protein [Commensalibacter communis]CAI3929702.1 Uncharacterized conserved protein [Commensalibacter communis]
MRLQFLNQARLLETDINNKYQFNGLSAIYYDNVTDTYSVPCDFGADGKPKAIDSFQFTGLYNPDGTPQIQLVKTPVDLTKIDDVRSVRKDPKGDGYWVTTESIKPSIYRYYNNGTVRKLGTIPNLIEISSEDEHKQSTRATFSPDGFYYVALQKNLKQDTPGYIRITKFDSDGQSVAQYAYGTDSTSTNNNGVYEILAINNDQLLVLEREYTSDQSNLMAKMNAYARVYEINLKNAENILRVVDLNSTNAQLVPKNLVLDLEGSSLANAQEYGLTGIVNMSLGPTLFDGRRSVVFASNTQNTTTSAENTKLVSYALDTTSSNLQLYYINQVGLPFDYKYRDSNGVTYRIGGLSGIDYDPKTDTYIVESDHQTIDGASLGYSVMFRIKLHGLTDVNSRPTVEFLSAQPLVNEKGNPISDAESIRLDPNGNGFWYTTEEKPAGIYHYHQDGSVTKVAVPENIALRAQDNLSLEGSTFAPDGSYYIAMERNLTGDATGYSRITKYDENGNITAQYAYYTDRPSTIGATSNGISEILALDSNTLLIMERGNNRNQTGVTEGVSSNRVRIYKVSLIGAQNVLNIDYLTAENAKLLDKTKIFDSQDPSIVDKLNTNETKIDNIEGMALGPKLPDGRQSLILVSDNNFNPSQYKTQFISLALDDGDACFLPGTFIRTQNGMVRVEDIMPGDLVYSLGHRNVWQLRQVVWVGKQKGTVIPYKHDDMAGYPVCIRKNAFEEGVPFADLYVTAEHCMFFEGCFVPVRMLVNGKTVFYDRSATTYDYYHIELEKHSIIEANGALSESYLDTGNRHYFESKSLNNATFNKIKNWDRDAAAPIITKRGNAHAIFNFLDQRADRMCVQSVEAKRAKTNDPNVYLLTDRGSKILPMQNRDQKILFELPSTTQSVRLMSRTYRPCDAFGPFVDNRYNLGISVGKICLHHEDQEQIIDIHLSKRELSGWLPLSELNARWTAGNALLPLQPLDTVGSVFLSIQIIETGSYFVDD